MHDTGGAAAPRRHPLEKLTRALAGIGGVVLLFMMLHISLDVVMKYVFYKPVQGTLEVVSHYYMVIAVFLPLGFLELKRESISVDVFYNMMPRAVKIFAVVLALVIMVVMFSALCYRSIFDALHAYGINEKAMGSAETVVWPTRFVLPFGYAVAALVSLWSLVGVVTGRDLEDWLKPHDAELAEV